jgi:NTP-dependent ternary system trypsin peptidase co-occuring protein
MPAQLLPLVDVIRSLRAEIQEATTAGIDESLRFKLGPIELEFQVVAAKEAGADGKISFHIFGVGAEIGGNAKGSDQRTQRIKLVLTPVKVSANGTRSDVLAALP